MVMGEEPAAPVRRIHYTPPLPGLTPIPDTGPPSLLSTRGGVASCTWSYTYVVWMRGRYCAVSAAP